MEDCEGRTDVSALVPLTEQEIHFLYSVCAHLTYTAHQAGDIGKQAFASRVTEKMRKALLILEKK